MKADSTWGLIGIPLLVLIFSTVVLQAVLVPAIQLVLPISESDPVTSGSTVMMILSVLISFVVMMKVGKLSREDLGLTSS
ncbi:hypothetical protein, partial [Stomatohabitans albus]|uniref:hypothetical protein n=1 Tax=Stomatohabitans albus TaxID=3110766 RepID=UPI00300D0262